MTCLALFQVLLIHWCEREMWTDRCRKGCCGTGEEMPLTSWRQPAGKSRKLADSAQISTEQANYKTHTPVFGQSALQLPLPGISSDGINFHLTKWKSGKRWRRLPWVFLSVSNTSSCLDSCPVWTDNIVLKVSDLDISEGKNLQIVGISKWG